MPFPPAVYRNSVILEGGKRQGEKIFELSSTII